MAEKHSSPRKAREPEYVPAVIYQSGHARLEEVMDYPGLYTLSIPRLKTGILIHARELLDVGEAIARNLERLESEAKAADVQSEQAKGGEA